MGTAQIIVAVIVVLALIAMFVRTKKHPEDAAGHRPIPATPRGAEHCPVTSESALPAPRPRART